MIGKKMNEATFPLITLIIAICVGFASIIEVSGNKLKKDGKLLNEAGKIPCSSTSNPPKDSAALLPKDNEVLEGEINLQRQQHSKEPSEHGVECIDSEKGSIGKQATGNCSTDNCIICAMSFEEALVSGIDELVFEPQWLGEAKINESDTHAHDAESQMNHPTTKHKSSCSGSPLTSYIPPFF